MTESRLSRLRHGLRHGLQHGVRRGAVLVDAHEQRAVGGFLARWVLLGAAIGVLAGLSSALVLVSLEWATDTRLTHGWLLYVLPVAGLIVGLIYHAFGGQSAQGNNLILDQIHEQTAWIPRRLAPLVYAATVVTHLFGGSAGREGTAVQMSGSLTDGIVVRAARLQGNDRRLALIAAISGGFGAVFGVPVAGAVFGLEVQAMGRLRHDALVPAVTASIVGDQVVRRLGVHHAPQPVVLPFDLTLTLAAKLVLVGVCFGLAAIAFTELTHGLKRLFGRMISWPPLRPFVGGLVVIALTVVVGNRDYLGLSLPLIHDAVNPTVGVASFAFAWKLIFTSVTLGSGFQGGEVTPLFVIGATLGATLGAILGGPAGLFAAVGFVAVFAGASNTPIACTIMGAELFGVAAIVPMAIVCAVSYTVSAHRGIYASQRVQVNKTGEVSERNASVADLARDRSTKRWQ